MADKKLKVVLFSGGRGTGSISEALLKYSDIDLTMLVNAYDDGLSTGLLRRFIPGMLGPSDIRKVVSSLLKHQSDQSAQALRKLLEYRFPEPTDTKEAVQLIDQLIAWHSDKDIAHEILVAKEHLSLSQMRQVSQFLEAFLRYYDEAIDERPWFTFSDNSLGNLLFSGCYLLSGRDFNRTIHNFSLFAGVEGRVHNITQGESLVLTGIKEDGRYLVDEASVVGPQDSVPIEEIFLLKNYLDPRHPKLQGDKAEKIDFLRSQECLPAINPIADKALREADMIIYGPGTQHSSLYPSYLTVGVAEAIRANTAAEKIFIANIARDHDILGADATALVDGFLFNMGRKDSFDVRGRQVITRFFFQKPESVQGATNYVPFEAGSFAYPLEKVVWVDLEGDKGKHSGGRTAAELLIIVEEQLRKRVRHVPHKVSIIVPALNEERTIQQVIKDLKQLQFPELGLEKEIIVVDGGSTDKTYDLIAGDPFLRTYQLDKPLGRGAALRLGIEKARGDIVVFFPSDGEYYPEDVSRVITPLLNREFPVVLGSRAFQSHDLSDTLERIYGRKGVMYTVSKYGGMLLSILTLSLYHRYVSDPLTSVKGFNARVFRGLEFQSNGVSFDMELIAKLAKARYSMLEVPVSYKARTVEEGKKITVKDGVGCLWALIRFARHTHRPVKLIPLASDQELQDIAAVTPNIKDGAA